MPGHRARAASQDRARYRTAVRHNVRVATAPVPAPPEPTATPPARSEASLSRRRVVTSLVSLGVMTVMLLVAMFLPVPYVIERPGPAINVLGDYEGAKILTIEGHEQYPTDGELMMTTVSVDGGPGYTVTPAEVVLAWFDRSQAVVPREAVFPDAETRQQTSLRNATSMSSSQQAAVAVALEELGIPFTPEVIVGGVLEGGPAEGTLEAGDVVVSVEGQSRGDAAGYQALSRAVTAGQPVTMVVRRDGAEQELKVPTKDVDGRTTMGIQLAAGYDFPVDVTLTVKDVGGPSAGTMFALAIYDELTPGALTGGKDIAGTGTIDAAGTVGGIGGIRQKMVGARDEGADYFLAPSANCDEVVGHVPEGLHVVSVSTFQDALTATETIGRTGSTDGLPTCTS